VAKLPQTLIVLALLGATAAAFAVTERLKLERSPITGTRVDRLFSPVCECAPNAATISFVLRQRSEVTVDVLDSAGEVVRTLVRDRDEPRGRVTYTWDGRDEAGRIVPEARYRPRVRIAERPPEPDPGRHDAAARALHRRLPARVLAGRRR
jgi:FlgD Ig-like domain